MKNKAYRLERVDKKQIKDSSPKEEGIIENEEEVQEGDFYIVA